MKVAKSLAVSALVACCISAQPAHSSDFVKNLLQQFSGTVTNWDDLENRRATVDSQIRQAVRNGDITRSDADTLRVKLNPITDAVIQGRASGKPLTFTQGMLYAQTINSVTASLQQMVATKQSALPDVDALQSELTLKIDEAYNSNQLTQDDATKLRGELRTVADIESTIKSSGDGNLSPKQIETLSTRLSDIQTQLAQAMKMGQSAIPELTNRAGELQSRINGAANANQIEADQARQLTSDLDRSVARRNNYVNNGQYLNGKQILELAGELDRISSNLQSAIAAKQARTAVQQAPAAQPPVYQNSNPINVVNTADSMPYQDNGTKYKDVAGSWGEPYVSTLASRGILGGFPDGTFHPNDNITRAQCAAIALKALSVPAYGGVSSFNDVSPKYWASAAIGAVSNAGLVTGFPDGTFKPEDRLTRAQALVILAKALGNGAGNASDVALYSDAQAIPGWALPSVTRAASAHIIANFPDPSIIAPNALATRGEVAALMYQTLLAMNKPLPRISIGVLPQFATATTQVVTPSQPVQTQPTQAPPVEALRLGNVEVTPSGSLTAGEVITVRAFGTANAMATFSIKDGVQDVPMEERRDGVYVGSYTVRRSDNIGRTRVSVNLSKGADKTSARQGRGDLMLDAMPPEIDVQPNADGVAYGAQPNIVVKFTDGHGSGVDPASVHLLVNGADVTSQSIVDAGMIAYKPVAPISGMVSAQIKLADKCGNAVDYSWRFTMRPGDGPGPGGPGNFPNNGPGSLPGNGPGWGNNNGPNNGPGNGPGNGWGNGRRRGPGFGQN